MISRIPLYQMSPINFSQARNDMREKANPHNTLLAGQLKYMADAVYKLCKKKSKPRLSQPGMY